MLIHKQHMLLVEESNLQTCGELPMLLAVGVVVGPRRSICCEFSLQVLLSLLQIVADVAATV